MKFNKKVIESGIVTAGMIAIIMTAVPTKDMTVETKQYTREEVLLEAEQEVATKEKVQVNTVAASAAASEVDEKNEVIEAFTPMDASADTKNQSAQAEGEAVSQAGDENQGQTENQSPQTGAETGNENQNAPEGNIQETQPENQEQGNQAGTNNQETQPENQEQGNQTGTNNQETQPENQEQGNQAGTNNQETQPGNQGQENQPGVQDQETQTGAESQENQADVGNQEVSVWESRLMPNVEEYLNIRSEAGEEAELAGKLHKGAVAEIIEPGEEWSKIKSGNVEGYVKNEFCVFGAEAETMANEQGTTYATAMTGGLRVRAEASDVDGTKILDVLEEGAKVKVDTAAEAPEGWVAVVEDDQTAFVSAEFVNVELELKEAISIEEEQAAIKKAQEEAAQKAAKKSQKSSSGSSSAGTTQKDAVEASYDDVTLLGALIQCEAGSESYEGKVAVGAVVMNRVRSGYAGSISGVIYQSGQFSPASSGALSSVLSNGVSGSCIQAAQEALGGADNVGGATSFRSTSSGADGIVIGNHVFF